MSAVKELIKQGESGGISFGDYTLEAKSKKDDFSYDGDIYKIKTFGEITKLEKNEMFLYESVPGSSVNDFVFKGDELSFTVEAKEDINITLGLVPDSKYDVALGGEDAGEMSTNFSGKLNLSVELDEGVPTQITIKKVD